MAIDNFDLPRKDWYDKEGRIFKDALIENFNAIEAKLLELSALNPIDVILPDVANKDYEDTTLSSPDTKVVNLKSFIDIMNLKGFPIICEFASGEVKQLTYYDNAYKLQILKDIELTGLGVENKNYILLDYTANNVYTSDNPIPNQNDILIGIYNSDNETIFSIKNAFNYCDINVLANLSKMKFEPITYDSGKGSKGQTQFNKGRIIAEWYNGKYGWQSKYTFPDYGRITKG